MKNFLALLSPLQFHRSPRRPVIGAILFLALQPNLAVAVATDENLPVITQASIELTPTPFLVSWCEGKNCEHQFSNQVVCKSWIYNDARTDSKKMGELEVGETISTRVYYTKILKLGSYLPIEGATRILVSRVDEHSWLSFFDHAWDSENDVKDHVVFPMNEAWALIKTKSGLSGFVKLEGSGKKTCPFKKAQ